MRTRSTADMPAPLVKLPISFDVPQAALRHSFVREVRATIQVLAPEKGVSNGGVIGTANTRRPELYGWHNPVSPHMDNVMADQWIYGLLLSGACRLGCIDTTTGEIHSASIRPGDIFRLNDRMPHWTQGRGGSVSVFVGELDSPDDAGAVLALERGLRRLAAGVWTAPRVSDGFKVALDGMCWATPDFVVRRLLRRPVAERLGWEVISCSGCDQPAVEVDNHWPYFWEGNSCLACSGS